MAELTTAQVAVTKKFWEGTNFWVSLALLVAGGFAAYTTQTGDLISGAIIAIFAAGPAIRILVNSGFDVKRWWQSANTKQYLGVLIAIIFGEQFADLVDPIRSLINAISAGNVQAILSAAVNIVTIIYFLLKPENAQEVLRILGKNEVVDAEDAEHEEV